MRSDFPGAKPEFYSEFFKLEETLKQNIFLFSVIAAMLFGSNAVFTAKLQASQNLIFSADNAAAEANQSTPFLREQTIFWQEDFEQDYAWTSYDATLTDAEWHLTTTDAYAGYSWWMGDPEIGGYLDGVYVVLDTDPILVPQNGSLSFKLNYNCEPPGSDPSTPLYNGWDGCNVRISTDGENWQVISGSPAYDASSFYSFGVEHGEGPDIPGWAGSSDGWVDAEFDLSAYSGQQVQLRFAFASDPATNTQDNGAYFGMMLDDIVLGDYSNAGVSAGMTAGNLVEGGGDHWQQVSPGYQSENAVACTEDGEIGANWYNYYESPVFHLAYAGDYHFDLMLKGEFDQDSFWGCEIAYRIGSNWSDWHNISNITNQPDQTNYVFGSPQTEWMSASQLYDIFPVDLTEISGRYIKLRVYLKTSDNATGSGIIFDDFTIWETTYPAEPPAALQANLNADYSVDLSWQAPEEDGLSGYNVYRVVNDDYQLLESTTDNFYHDTDPNYESFNHYAVTALFEEDETDYSASAIVYVPALNANWLWHDDGSSETGFNAGALNHLAVQFFSEQSYLTHLQIYLEELASADLNFKIWDNSTANLPATEIATFSVDNQSLDLGWNLITIPEAIRPQISDGTFWLGLLELANSAALGLDTDSSGYSMQKVDGVWQDLAGNIMLRALVDDDLLAAGQEQMPLPQYNLSNYPNPFVLGANSRATATKISFDLVENSEHQISIYNLKGQKVKSFASQNIQRAGRSGYVAWQGRDQAGKEVASGVYFYRLQIDGKPVAMQKMLLLK
ncbi:MAG: immune inhibitor A [Candidatus Cloacimonadales bacterium]